MKKFFLLSCFTLFSACTISIILTDTHGTATDIVDDTPTTDVKADANVQVPVKPF